MAKRELQASIANRLAATARTSRPPARAAANTHLQRAIARPSLAAAHDVVQLQQRYGNRAVQRWLAHNTLQAKLTVGPAGDHYEREADRVADQVVDRVSALSAPATRRGAAVQRQGDDETRVQRQPLAATITPLVQRKPVDDDEIQRKGLEDDELRRQALEDDELKRAPEAGGRAGGTVGNATGAAIEQARGGGQRLPESVRRPMESAFGADFHGVKVHTDGRADQLSRSLSARAFTTGRDVFFRKGEFSPASRQGQKLLAHELTHVVQQGGAHPTVRRALSNETETGTKPPAEEAAPDLRDAMTGKRVDRLQPGDVLVRRGGEELAADLAQYSRYLQQLWRGQARGANGSFPSAGIFLGGGMLARGGGRGVAKAPVQGDYYVFRCGNRALAELAARLAANWSVFENSASGVQSKYSIPKNFDTLAHSSRYNKSRAVNLAAYFLRGATVNNLLTADFAIMCYQAAALEEDVDALKGASPAPAPAAQENGAGQPKTGLAALPPGALRLDPRRIREFQFAAELHRLASGDSPSWDLAGLY